MNISRNSGLYIHIPFCISKCGYCDFYSIVETSLTDTFIDALLTEIRLSAAEHNTEDCFDTIYIGGGTPSLLHPEHVRRILEAISEHYNLDNDHEITYEINPGALEPIQPLDLLDLGINRISIGVQSFIQDELKTLERIHTVQESITTINSCRKAGYANLNLDLIFAIPQQTKSHWNYSLEKALSFKPEHLSVYNLTYEEGTPFYKKLQAGQIIQQNEQLEIDYFSTAHDLLTEAGYIHYEVSNYAKSESHYSRHNYKYWEHVPYLGFGPSAHSFQDQSRWANVKSVHEYISRLNRGQLPKSFEEELTRDQLISEYLFLSLRTNRGLSISEFRKRFDKNLYHDYARETEELINNKLAISDGDFFKLTMKGMLICDEILLHFTNDK